MNSGPISWGQCLVIAAGELLLLGGATRFFLAARFGWMDALHCCLAMVPAGLFLLVFDYVIHHARLASVIPLVAAIAVVVSSPAFDVGLGLALMGAVAAPAAREWREERRARVGAAAESAQDR